MLPIVAQYARAATLGLRLRWDLLSIVTTYNIDGICGRQYN